MPSRAWNFFVLSVVATKSMAIYVTRAGGSGLSGARVVDSPFRAVVLGKHGEFVSP